VGGDAPELADDETRDGETGNEANGDTDQEELQALPQDHLENIETGGAEGDADAKFMGLAGDAVGHDTVYTDGDQDQADGGKEDHQLQAEARLSKRKKIEKVIERVGFCHCDVGVGGPDFTANGIDHGSGIAAGAKKQAAHSSSGEGVGDPSFGIDRILEAEVLRVGSHTNDFEPGVLDSIGKIFQGAKVNPAANGIFVAEVAALKGLIDDGELAAVVDFRFGEGAAIEKREAKNGEIVFAAKLNEAVPLLGIRFSGDFDDAAKSPVRRPRAGFGRVGDSGDGLQSREQGAEEGSELGGVLVSLRRERNAPGENMVYLEAQMDFLEGEETANEQARSE